MLGHGKRITGGHFSIDEICVLYWRGQHDKLKATNKACQAFSEEKTARFPLVKEVLEYIREPLKEGCGVLLEMIRNQVLTIVRKQGILVKDFRASSGWTTCFMRQNELSLRWQTSSCQWLQSTYEVINFHCFVTRSARKRASSCYASGMLTKLR